VPTPLSKTKDPDLSYVLSARAGDRAALRPGQLIILESTTYPGTTREVVLPVLEETGLKAGEDFFLCFSPERVDPGNPSGRRRTRRRCSAASRTACTEAGVALYERFFDTLVPVSSAEAAELVKVYENTFRMINIALVNELAQVCERLGVDVWEVIDAAAHQAVRLHEVHARAPGSAATASRSTRTTSPGRCGRSRSRRA
jgi:UDP-N-acetyl-D-glucosamine dehydrogenase